MAPGRGKSRLPQSVSGYISEWSSWAPTALAMLLLPPPRPTLARRIRSESQQYPQRLQRQAEVPVNPST